MTRTTSTTVALGTVPIAPDPPSNITRIRRPVTPTLKTQWMLTITWWLSRLLPFASSRTVFAVMTKAIITSGEVEGPKRLVTIRMPRPSPSTSTRQGCTLIKHHRTATVVMLVEDTHRVATNCRSRGTRRSNQRPTTTTTRCFPSLPLSGALSTEVTTAPELQRVEAVHFSSDSIGTLLIIPRRLGLRPLSR